MVRAKLSTKPYPNVCHQTSGLVPTKLTATLCNTNCIGKTTLGVTFNTKTDKNAQPKQCRTFLTTGMNAYHPKISLIPKCDQPRRQYNLVLLGALRIHGRFFPQSELLHCASPKLILFM